MKKALITYKLNPEIAKELDGKVEYVLPKEKGFRRKEVLEMIGDFDILSELSGKDKLVMVYNRKDDLLYLEWLDSFNIMDLLDFHCHRFC